MATLNINNAKQTIGFFSMTLAWAIMNIAHSIYLVWKDGKADDSGVIIFWSGLFALIAWAVFIIYPLKRLHNSSRIFKPTTFPFITAFYGALAYATIVGGLFRSLDLVNMFMPLALVTGFVFGISYSALIRSASLVSFLTRRPFMKIFFFLSPAIILFVFLKVLPTVAPSFVFRYVPDEVRYKIVAETIPKFKVGDKIEPLKNSLPGYLDNIQNGKGNIMASMEHFAFVLQVNCGKIIRLQYGKNPNDFDNTIYGKLEEQPCP